MEVWKAGSLDRVSRGAAARAMPLLKVRPVTIWYQSPGYQQDLINIEIFRISFNFFYSFSFILHSRATSVWYQSLTSIRDQVIYFCFKFSTSFSNIESISATFSFPKPTQRCRVGMP